jgi:MFS family permease
MILSVFTHAVTFSTIAFTSLFLVDEFGMSEAAGGAILSIFYSAGLWASVMGGYLSDRWGGVPVILASSFISGPVIYLMNVVPFGVGIGFLLFILGIGSYVRTPVSEAYILKQIPEGRRSTILGLYYFFNIEGGGILTPVMGFLVDRSGFRAGFGMAGASVVVVSLVCLIWLRGSRN